MCAYKRIAPQPIIEGGTGVQSNTAYTVLCGGTTTTSPIQSIASVGTSGQVLTSNGASALPTFQTVGSSGITSITGNTGGAQSGPAITLTGGTTGLSFGGATNTITTTFAGITANGGTVALATDATTSAVNIGTGAGVKTVVLGSTNSTSVSTLQAGTGGITIASGTGTVSISNDASANSVNLGTGAAVKTVTVGSTNSTSATTVQSGSGILHITATNGAITMNAGTGTTGIATDATISIVNVGTGSAAKTTSIGSTSASSTLTLNAPSAGMTAKGVFGATASSSVPLFINSSGLLGTAGGSGGSIFATSYNGDSGTATPSSAAINIKTGTSTQNCGSSVSVTATGSTMTLNVTDSNGNTIVGNSSGNASITGNDNTLFGEGNGGSLTSGVQNTLIGQEAGHHISTGSWNTLIGQGASYGITTSNYNICIGYDAAYGYTTANNDNIVLGNFFTAGGSDSNVLRIGSSTGTSTGVGQLNAAYIQGIYGITAAGATAAVINSSGQLGTVISSRRFKHNIEDMGDESSLIYSLRPVTFAYNSDEKEEKQYGLIAEEVDAVFPEIVIHNENGQSDTVQYHILPTLLLNELQKLAARVETLEAICKENNCE